AGGSYSFIRGAAAARRVLAPEGGAAPSGRGNDSTSGEMKPIMRLIRVALVVGSIMAMPAAALAQAPARPGGPAGPGGGAGPGPGAAATAPEPGGEARAVTQAILEEIDKRSELMANIEYLCDMIGPRLTGSPGLTRANQWTRDRFRQYGLANAHLESWMIERAWTRREARGRVVVP